MWSECVCPDYKWACTEGELVTCTCPDGHTKHETKCLLGGWVECPCEGGGGTGEGGGTGGGAGGAPGDDGDAG